MWTYARFGYLQEVRQLLEKEFDVDEWDPETQSCSPLMAALSVCNNDIALELINAGANPNSRDSSNRTPFTLAVSMGWLNFVSVLIKAGAHLDQRCEWDGVVTPFNLSTALHYGATKADFSLVKCLVETQSPLKVTLNAPKRRAISEVVNFSKDICSIIMKFAEPHGANLDLRDGRKCLAAEVASYKADSEVNSARRDRYRKIVNYLSPKGEFLTKSL